jgi:hypothetical protein
VLDLSFSLLSLRETAFYRASIFYTCFLLARSELRAIIPSPALVPFVSPLDSPLTLMIVADGSSYSFVMTSQSTQHRVLDSTLTRDTVILIEIIRVFILPLQVSEMRDRFLPDPFLFMPLDTTDYQQRQRPLGEPQISWCVQNSWM